MANIAEGFDRNRAAEFHQALSIAKASAAEVRSHLYAVLDAGYASAEELASLRVLALETSTAINGLRAAVSRKLEKGPSSAALSTQHSAPSTRLPGQ